MDGGEEGREHLEERGEEGFVVEEESRSIERVWLLLLLFLLLEGGDLLEEGLWDYIVKHQQ